MKKRNLIRASAALLSAIMLTAAVLPAAGNARLDTSAICSDAGDGVKLYTIDEIEPPAPAADPVPLHVADPGIEPEYEQEGLKWA